MVDHIKTELEVSYGQYSDKGQKESNDDCLGIRVATGSELTLKGVVVAIADGVSAAVKGKAAAEICIQNFLNDYYEKIR